MSFGLSPSFSAAMKIGAAMMVGGRAQMLSPRPLGLASKQSADKKPRMRLEV